MLGLACGASSGGVAKRGMCVCVVARARVACESMPRRELLVRVYVRALEWSSARDAWGPRRESWLVLLMQRAAVGDGSSVSKR